jgi:hypothetical protein
VAGPQIGGVLQVFATGPEDLEVLATLFTRWMAGNQG